MTRREQDSFGRRAKKEGFPARSVYKLEELDQKFKIFSPNQRVLDLGCHPGSWLIYAARKVGPKGKVVGVDLQKTTPPAPHVLTLEQDIFQIDPKEFCQEHGPFDVVMSDMAPATSGARDVDHLRSMALAERALEFAHACLVPGGSFLVKIFMGGELDPFVLARKKEFSKVSRLRPKGTRSESREIYVICQGKIREEEPGN